ncbi:MAG: bifunctional helix-turn-helix domain-containing protein/methylated-DNA--[protein]-cysteine S-methyltransferase [Nodosilinea sp. WJT8-NPBG4]|jgi:AraC family transcriptional regulator of adaptative response/methylated-DNA-[protein]-cysteine methyltransferase|nr:bifunctional helix-turn-helix domain-containing protein/methylated-DNA--[protein]-cysteine S-methyltransferase [Nodosilinea sp. WJT8-NPBG4]
MNPVVETATHDDETYRQIAEAIAFLRQHHLDQPDLTAIASHVHLSQYHFQRLFTQWAGISPKRFLQNLTVDYAKAKIAETKSLLELTENVGLSSLGRLHDLFVTLEAMSPGEFKAGGAGLEISYGIHATPFGPCLLAKTARGICNLHFLDAANRETAERLLRAEWPGATLVADQSGTAGESDRIFTPNPDRPLALAVKGTNFQIQVWRALLQIPPGGLTTYQDLAEAIGRPTAARAVGNAIGRNPVGYLIPCHRVIRASGEWGGYRWGAARKTLLLGWEAGQTQTLRQEA